MRSFLKSGIKQRLQPFQNHHFKLKIKRISKNISKTILQVIQNCSVQKTAGKNKIFKKKRPFSKSAIMQRLQLLQNPHLGSKIQIPKNMSKPTLQIIQSCSVKKTARKDTKYQRNETILKIGHHAKAIGFARSLLWTKN